MKFNYLPRVKKYTMKKTIKIASVFVMILCFFSSEAQYNSAAGIRISDGAFLGTYKLNMNNKLSLEGMAGFSTSNNSDGIVLGAEFHLNTEIPDIENLRWFYGAGALLGIGEGDSGLFAFGTGGADYSFEEIPLNLSLQGMPGLFFGNTSKFNIDFAISARYILSY